MTGFESAIAALGLGELVLDQARLAQIGLLAFSSFLFLCSIAVCGMAFRAASAAKRAQREALDLAVEVRHLTVQVEKATARRHGEPQEATGEMSAGDNSNAVGAAAGESAEPDRTLEEAKKAATVPSALLRNLARRRF